MFSQRFTEFMVKLGTTNNKNKIGGRLVTSKNKVDMAATLFVLTTVQHTVSEIGFNTDYSQSCIYGKIKLSR